MSHPDSPNGDSHSLAMEKLRQQIRFVTEIDKLKTVLRQTLLTSDGRRENDAEHSWHVAMMAVILAEYARDEIDLLRVITMLLIHDIVEIDAGDTFCYDDVGRQDQRQREERAADRIFGLLPNEQAREFRALWEEFDDGISADARYAGALDRLQPLMHNYLTQGAAWQRHKIKRSQVLERNARIADGAPALWDYARELIDESTALGYLADD